MIRWGIIGAGNIAKRFAHSLAQIEEGSLYAVANRTLEKAEAFKAIYPCEKAYGSYEALLDDAQIEMVYIALPHQSHFEWIKQALLKQKGVLCEKPATMNAAQMKEIKNLAKANKVFFMEAMKNRFVPASEKINERIQRGEIGQITQISTSLCRDVSKEGSTYHYLPEQGGCLLDLGIYNAGLIESLVKAPLMLKEIEALLEENQVETYVKATLENAEVQVILETAFNEEKPAIAVITGTKGAITIFDFHRPTTFVVTLKDEQPKFYEYPYLPDDFAGEIKEAMRCFANRVIESSQMSLDASIRCITLIDVIKEAIKNNYFKEEMNENY